MAIVGGFDVHRKQITFDYVDTETGSISRGEIRPGDRGRLRGWLQPLRGQQAAFALEATTGWRLVVEELEAAGIEAYLAEPADTRAARGRKKRAKTDREDARHLRELLQTGRLPESWIPPAHIQELRSLVRLRKTLCDERRAWKQRIQAILFHHGAPAGARLGRWGRAGLSQLELSAAGQAGVELALRMIEHIEAELKPLERQLWAWARRLVGCQALMAQYGVGQLTALASLTEHGDSRRFSSSRKAVRNTGLDVTVHRSDEKRAPGQLSRPALPASSPGRDRRSSAGPCSRPPSAPAEPLPPTMSTTGRPRRDSAITGPACRSPAS
jgi:transposase